MDTGQKSVHQSSSVAQALPNAFNDWSDDERVKSDDDPCYKFGVLLTSNFGVNATQLCTAGVDWHSG